MTELIATYFLLGAFVGLGIGVCWSQKSFRDAIKTKADTGIRMECDGRLFTIHSVEIEG